MSLSADHGISHLEHRTESADQLSELIGKFSNMTMKKYRLFSYRPAGTKNQIGNKIRKKEWDFWAKMSCIAVFLKLQISAASTAGLKTQIAGPRPQFPIQQVWAVPGNLHFEKLQVVPPPACGPRSE